MRQPLVSVITPSFNSVRFIEQTILSVKNQTYKKIEHIIIDGGSTDGTIEILRKYESDNHIKWISEPDNGLYFALNKGIKIAKGEIIAELDCDDLYLPWTVETAVRYLNNKEFIFGDTISFDGKSKKVKFGVALPFISSYYRAKGIISQPTVFLTKSIIDGVGCFNTNFRLLGDVEYFLRINKNGVSTYKVNEILAITRHPESSLTNTYKKIQTSELKTIRTFYSKKYEQYFWNILPLGPIISRIYLLLFWLQCKNIWPQFKKSFALQLNIKDVLKLFLLRSQNFYDNINWNKIVPSEIVHKICSE